ncbi:MULTISPECIES: hypothetical protein [unclassified Streptomyces]|uniref:hypothetical protein n=1 Tax=unclassified Streptomyces TaxID=2593676 RepID=UPI001BE8F3BC|nr:MULTISPECIES: hypothetical protein [unclassified Streptomyces]MBT2402741.1 hypothetical protein [Streptomyces sp. ISL-21]MBT2607301.1 hypothetical protein [Streptomyces sp. ISL-87]
MTSTTGTIRHPDVSEISDLTEGLLSPARTAEVRRHLGDCVLCADVRASLDEIRSLLGTLPGPPRMPVGIAGRIDAALAAEALLDATTPRAEAAPAEQALPDVSRETSAGAAGPGGHRPAGHPVGATGPGRRRARRRIALIAGLTGAAACALAVFLVNGLSGTPAHDTAARNESQSSAAQPTAGTYTAQGMPGSIRQLLATAATAESPKASAGEQNNTYGMENESPPAGVAPGDRRVPPVPPCVQDATGRPEAPLASERGSYQGAPVYLLVFPHPGDAARVDAYLVGSGCANTPGENPAKASEKPLLTGTYPRT